MFSALRCSRPKRAAGRLASFRKALIDATKVLGAAEPLIFRTILIVIGLIHAYRYIKSLVEGP